MSRLKEVDQQIAELKRAMEEPSECVGCAEHLESLAEERVQILSRYYRPLTVMVNLVTGVPEDTRMSDSPGKLLWLNALAEWGAELRAKDPTPPGNLLWLEAIDSTWRRSINPQGSIFPLFVYETAPGESIKLVLITEFLAWAADQGSRAPPAMLQKLKKDVQGALPVDDLDHDAEFDEAFDKALHLQEVENKILELQNARAETVKEITDRDRAVAALRAEERRLMTWLNERSRDNTAEPEEQETKGGGAVEHVSYTLAFEQLNGRLGCASEEFCMWVFLGWLPAYARLPNLDGKRSRVLPGDFANWNPATPAQDVLMEFRYDPAEVAAFDPASIPVDDPVFGIPNPTGRFLTHKQAVDHLSRRNNCDADKARKLIERESLRGEVEPLHFIVGAILPEFIQDGPLNIEQGMFAESWVNQWEEAEFGEAVPVEWRRVFDEAWDEFAGDSPDRGPLISNAPGELEPLEAVKTQPPKRSQSRRDSKLALYSRAYYARWESTGRKPGAADLFSELHAGDHDAYKLIERIEGETIHWKAGDQASKTSLGKRIYEIDQQDADTP